MVESFDAGRARRPRARALEALIGRDPRAASSSPPPSPHSALCFGCPAAARLCPHPKWRPGWRMSRARRLRLRLAGQPGERGARRSADRSSRRPGAARGLARARWTLGRDNLRSEKTFARADGSLPPFCLGLNLEPDPGAPAPNGVLIEVTEAELERLDLREMRYHRIDVTGAIATEPSAAEPFTAVFAYGARPEHHYPAPPADAVSSPTTCARSSPPSPRSAPASSSSTARPRGPARSRSPRRPWSATGSRRATRGSW